LTCQVVVLKNGVSITHPTFTVTLTSILSLCQGEEEKTGKGEVVILWVDEHAE